MFELEGLLVSRHRRTHVTLVLITALLLLAAGAAACSAQASGEGTGGASTGDGSGATGSGSGTSASAASAKGGASDDWSRIAQALAWMQVEKPAKPVVVLLGGSAARESTVSDASWRAQIVTKGGPSVLAWNMGSHNRTMAQNLAIVKALPMDVPAIVFIGINLGSFTSPQRTATITLPSPAPTGSEISLQQPHQYGVKTTGVLSTTKKQALVRQWLSKRYPVYKANFRTNAAILARIVELCQNRHYTPVLLELPRNSAVIGSALNAPTTKYRDKCRSLAAKYSVPWVPQLASLPNKQFYDLWHLVEPGRAVWQAKLSAKTATLLHQ